MMKYLEPLYRPPAEAGSLIFQVAYGCPHNHCRFCGMYKHVSYRPRPEAEVAREIAEAGCDDPETRRVFLADGDALALPWPTLKNYAERLNAALPRLGRINLYANGSSILRLGAERLTEWRELKGHTLYVGLESGSQTVLREFGKRETVSGMIEAVSLAQGCGLTCSVMVLVGLGGRLWREEHIVRTAEALNRMQPRLLSALRFRPVPGLPLPEWFELVSEAEAAMELKELIGRLELSRTVFRANHSTNPVPLAGRLPQDREALCRQLERELSAGRLETGGPGPAPWAW